MKRLFGILLLLSAIGIQPIAAKPQSNVTAAVDTTVHESHNVIESIIDYFNNSNQETHPSSFDFSFIGGPHYNSDTKFGIGLVAAGLYLVDKSDTISIPSNVSLYADITTTGFYMVGIRGNNIFSGDRQRINYDIYYSSFPRYYWGMGYKRNSDEKIRTKFDQRLFRISANYLVKVIDNIYIGPAFQYTAAKARSVTDTQLWDNQPMRVNTLSLGAVVSYDSRDNLTATQRGLQLVLTQQFCPSFLGNNFAFNYTDILINGFIPVWRGGIIGASLHGRFNYGNVPWSMMATFGGSNSMRGYYEGRYNDKCEMDATIELRQHIYGRSGAVAWVGVGSVFPNFRAFSTKELLPCAGIGYRWEFKRYTNVRLDFGVGRKCSSFIFSINEAF